MTEKFTPYEVASALCDVVFDKGSDYVYQRSFAATSSPSCLYKHTKVLPDGREEVICGCIVGAVLHALDEELFYNLAEGKLFRQQAPDILDRFDVPTQMALQEAQLKQDAGETWGTAESAFHHILNLAGTITL